MKNSFLPILLCGTLLPLSQAYAAGPAGKTYGGFSPGKKFSLIVTERSSTRTKGRQVTKNAPLPSGVPDYSKGDRVRFKSAKKANSPPVISRSPIAKK